MKIKYKPKPRKPTLLFKLQWNNDSKDYLLLFKLPFHAKNIRLNYSEGIPNFTSWAPTHQESRMIIALLAFIESLNGHDSDVLQVIHNNLSTSYFEDWLPLHFKYLGRLLHAQIEYPLDMERKWEEGRSNK